MTATTSSVRLVLVVKRCAAGLVLLSAIRFAVAANAAEPLTIQFRGAVNGAPFECGRSYAAVGLSKSAITAEDFRFYVHDVRLVDAAGSEHLLQLEQTKWQLERTALIDLENKAGDCSNGTAETNREVRGTGDGAGPWKGLRFTLGVPFNRNHTDLARMPAPLNLTAMAWAWNAGRRFAKSERQREGGQVGFAHSHHQAERRAVGHPGAQVGPGAGSVGSGRRHESQGGKSKQA